MRDAQSTGRRWKKIENVEGVDEDLRPSLFSAIGGASPTKTAEQIVALFIKHKT